MTGPDSAGDGMLGEKLSRAGHLQWCKDRAMEYVKAGHLRSAESMREFIDGFS